MTACVVFKSKSEVLVATSGGILYSIDTSKLYQRTIDLNLKRGLRECFISSPNVFNHMREFRELSFQETMVFAKYIRSLELPINCTPSCLCKYPLSIEGKNVGLPCVGFAIGCTKGVLVEIEYGHIYYSTISVFGDRISKIQFHGNLNNPPCLCIEESSGATHLRILFSSHRSGGSLVQHEIEYEDDDWRSVSSSYSAEDRRDFNQEASNVENSPPQSNAISILDDLQRELLYHFKRVCDPDERRVSFSYDTISLYSSNGTILTLLLLRYATAFDVGVSPFAQLGRS